MKKIIFTLALIVAAMNCFAQSNTYRDAARSLMEISASAMSPENIKKDIAGSYETAFNSISQMNGMDTNAKEKAKTMMDRLNKEVFDPYFGSDDFMNDMVDIMVPTLKKEFSETEVKELVEVYSTPEAKSLLEKGSASITNLSGMTQEMMPAITAISMGGDAPEVEKVECSDEYRQVFTEYYDLTTSAALQRMESQLASDDNPLSQKLLAYMKAALPEMTLKMCKDNLTVNDLKSGIKLVGNPLAQRYIKASTSIGDQVMESIMYKIGPKITMIMMQYVDEK